MTESGSIIYSYARKEYVDADLFWRDLFRRDFKTLPSEGSTGWKAAYRDWQFWDLNATDDSYLFNETGSKVERYKKEQSCPKVRFMLII